MSTSRGAELQGSFKLQDEKSQGGRSQGDLVRREVVQTTETVVIKLGTNVLSRPDDQLDLDRIAKIAAQIDRVRKSGRQVVVVSSGAVSAGMGLLGLTARPTDLPHLQASAACGQAHLIRLYNDALKPHGYHAAQLLLTANDFKSRSRYLNVRNTLATLFEYGAVPIVNENDTVSVDEIKFGDNDHLAAMVANLFSSSLLIILSIVDGLYDGSPTDPASRVIPLVEQWDDDLLSLAHETRSARGTGGMRSKLKAIALATSVGENVLIANGQHDHVIDEILSGQPVGTLFLATGQALPAWKRWIGFTVPPAGQLRLDGGACRALIEKGRSLLAAGILSVHGDFRRGEVVSLTSETGEEFARGLTNYAAHDVREIAGKRTDEIERGFGSLPYREVIHRNNLVLTGSP